MGIFKWIYNKLFGTGVPNIDRLLHDELRVAHLVDLHVYLNLLSKNGEELEKLNNEQRVFFFNENFEFEVNSEGFSGFFSNDIGRFAHETVASLQIIGAVKTAAILQKAIDKFPGGRIPKNKHERVAILDKLEGNNELYWQALDEEIHEYEDDLDDLNIEFIRKHRDKFVFTERLI